MTKESLDFDKRLVIYPHLKYRTESGNDVVIYTVNSVNPYYPVVGHIILPNGNFAVAQWTSTGKFSRFHMIGVSYSQPGKSLNLIEVKPQDE